MFIDEEIEFIKSQIDHHRRSVDHFRSKQDQQKVNRHLGILRRFEDILPKMQEANIVGLVPPVPESPPAKQGNIGSRFGDMSDLPPEIRQQLVSLQKDDMEQAILDVLEESYDGVATIDEILVALFRKTNSIFKRDGLATKIYRMTRKELLISVPGRKGVYALPEMAQSFSKNHETEDNGDDIE